MDEVRPTSLIDSLAPEFDAEETHAILINASRQTVYQALCTADWGESAIIKGLVWLRAMPAFVASGCRSFPQGRTFTLQTLVDSGFGLLAERPGDEIVLGVSGRFWRPTGNLSAFNRADFDKAVPAGLAWGIWNFSLADAGAGKTILSTQTRVVCGDSSSRRKFRTYWLIVRPFSGLIRLMLLKSVRLRAESLKGDSA